MRQVQDTDSSCGYFRLPLAWSWPGTETAGREWIDGAESSFEISVPEGAELPLFDPQRVIAGRIHVDYTAEECRLLLDGQRPCPLPWRLQLVDMLLRRESEAGEGSPGQEDRQLLYALARGDAHAAVRKAAATGLADLMREQPPWVEELRPLFLELAGDASPGVRATALNGLNAFRDPTLLPVFRRMLSDSSYYVEASAMNGILTLDSTGSVDVVRQRLLGESRNDVLALAALDWVRRYGYAELRDIVRQLAGPGHSARLRSASWETLMVLNEAGDALLAMVVARLGEPRPLQRMHAAAALRYFPPEAATRLLRAHLRIDTAHVRPVAPAFPAVPPAVLTGARRIVFFMDVPSRMTMRKRVRRRPPVTAGELRVSALTL